MVSQGTGWWVAEPGGHGLQPQPEVMSHACLAGWLCDFCHHCSGGDGLSKRARNRQLGARAQWVGREWTPDL